MNLIVNGTDDGLDSSLDGLNAGLERAQVVLSVAVELGSTEDGVERRNLHELQILQPLLLALSLDLQSTTTKSIETRSKRRRPKEIGIGNEFTASEGC